MGHRLPGHKGGCKNLHGHNYRITVEVQSNTLDEMGMVVDFAVLKEMRDKVLEHWDHCMLLWDNDPLLVLLGRGAMNSYHILTCDLKPTVEVIVAIWFQACQVWLKEHHPHTELSKMTVWETSNACAVYQPATGLRH